MLARWKPRLLLVARTRYALPLGPTVAPKSRRSEELFDLRVLATSADGRERDDGVFPARLPRARLIDGPLFYALLPFRVRRIAREHRPAVIVAQSPYEAALTRLARTGAKVVVEVHGDWRTATRLYGSRLRRVLAPTADAFGAWGVRRADAVRTISPYTRGSSASSGSSPPPSSPPTAISGAFQLPVEPLPAEPAVVFVGVLERYKNVDGLARPGDRPRPASPGPRSRSWDGGPTGPSPRSSSRPSRADGLDRAPTAGRGGERLDDATCLVLPSRSEGLGRVIIEAFLRGRAGRRVASAGSATSSRTASTACSSTPTTSSRRRLSAFSSTGSSPRSSAPAGSSVARWLTTPGEFAGRLAALVEATVSR